MKYDFDVDAVDLDGEVILDNKKPKKLCQILGNDLLHCSGTSGDPLRYFNWALDLAKGLPIDLDTEGREMLLNHIKKSETLTVLSKGRLNEVLNNAVSINNKNE